MTVAYFLLPGVDLIRKRHTHQLPPTRLQFLMLPSRVEVRVVVLMRGIGHDRYDLVLKPLRSIHSRLL